MELIPIVVLIFLLVVVVRTAGESARAQGMINRLAYVQAVWADMEASQSESEERPSFRILGENHPAFSGVATTGEIHRASSTSWKTIWINPDLHVAETRPDYTVRDPWQIAGVFQQLGVMDASHHVMAEHRLAGCAWAERARTHAL